MDNLVFKCIANVVAGDHDRNEPQQRNENEIKCDEEAEETTNDRHSTVFHEA